MNRIVYVVYSTLSKGMAIYRNTYKQFPTLLSLGISTTPVYSVALGIFIVTQGGSETGMECVVLLTLFLDFDDARIPHIRLRS